MELEDNIKRALKQVFDPEIPVNIVDLGLIYGIETGSPTEDGVPVTVIMTLTAPNCPIADEVVEDARIAASQVPGVSSATDVARRSERDNSPASGNVRSAPAAD